MTLAGSACDTQPPVHQLEIRRAFEQLSAKEKNYAHYMREAAFHGSRIIMRQVSPESETIFDLVIELSRACDRNWQSLADMTGVIAEDLTLFLEYAATVMENLGNYKGYGDQKFTPRLELRSLERLCSVTPAATALFGKVRGLIYAEAPKSLGYPSEGGLSNYYPHSPGLTRDEIRAVQDTVSATMSLRNTRLQKSVDHDQAVYHLLVASAVKDSEDGVTQDFHLTDGARIVVKYGDHSDCMKQMCESLAKARDFVATEVQGSYITKLISFYERGSVEVHKEASKDWLADESPCVETWSGFLEPGRDPSGVRCEFEALVAIQDKQWSAAFSELADKAQHLLLQLPWSGLGPEGDELGPFENESFIKPNFVALNLLCYCVSNVWTGLTAPGYAEVKAAHGRKNLTFSNRVAANNLSTQELNFIPEHDLASFKDHRSLCFFLQLALHEVIGHGSGKLLQETEGGKRNFDPNSMPTNPFSGEPVESWYKTGETPESAFGGLATAYIECLAEGMGLYLMSVEGAIRILAPDTSSDLEEVIYNAYLSIACMGLRGLLSYDPDSKKWGQVHDQARFGLLKCFLGAGHGFTTIHHDPDSAQGLTIAMDRTKIENVGRPALGDLIHRLQVFRCIKEVEQGSVLLENLTLVDEEALRWRATVNQQRRPRTLFIHANTGVDGNHVFLKEYPETIEGLIQSWVDRQ